MDKRRFVPRGDTLPSSSIVEMRLGERLWQELARGEGLWWNRLQGVHRQLLSAYGIPLPPCELSLDSGLAANAYQFRVAGGGLEGGILYPQRWFATGEAEMVSLLMGEEGREPVYGLEGRWIPDSRAEAADQLGCHLLSADALWAGHLSDRLERRLDVCLCPEWLSATLSRLGLKAGPGLRQQLCWLLEERVSIRALPLIVAIYREGGRTPEIRLRRIRQALGARVLTPWVEDHGRLATIAFSDSTTRRLRRELAREDGPDNWFLGLLLQQIYGELEQALLSYGEAALLIAGDLRRSLFELLPFELRRTPVLAFEEIPPDLECLAAGVVGSRIHPSVSHWPGQEWPASDT